MTIEEKLRKTLQTKTGLKEVINNKGGTITDETPFEEYIAQVNDIETGISGEAIEVSTEEEMEANLIEENKHKFYLYNGEDGQYTNGEYYAVVDDEETVVGDGSSSVNIVEYATIPVPNTGTLTSINFNTGLTNVEMDNIIINANLPCVPAIQDIPMYPILLGYNETAGIQVLLAVANYNEFLENMGATIEEGVYLYSIVGCAFIGDTIETLDIYVSQGVGNSEFGNNSTVGWQQENIDAINTLLTNIGSLTLMDDMDGVSVGSHNESISQIVNCGNSSEGTVLKTLKGEYASVGISVGQNTNIDLTTYMDNQQIPINVNVYVPNTLKILLDRTKTANSLFYTPSGVTHFSDIAFERIIKYDDTEKVEDFDNCFKQQGLMTKVPNLNYSNMRTARYMFENTTIRSATFDTPRLWNVTSMFAGCYNLEKVDFSNITGIEGHNAFSGCESLRALIIRTTSQVCQYGLSNHATSGVFTNTPIENGTGYIYVPDDLVESYKTADFWRTYASQIKPLSEYVE